MKTENKTESTFSYYWRKHHDQRIKLMEKFSSDISYQFAWLGEELYKESIKADIYLHIKNASVEDITLEQSIFERIKGIEQYLSRPYNVRGNSSGSLHNEVSTWKYIAFMEVLEELQTISL